MRINVGARIRAERKARNLSQADLERRTGFPRCRISYLENERAVPTIETLEKLSDALEIPLYQLLYDLRELRQHLNKMDEEDQRLLLFIARKIASRAPARILASRQSVRRDSSKGKGQRAEGRDL